MKSILKVFSILLIATIWSCSKDDSTAQPQSQTGSATFYTLSTASYSLIVDGVEYGKIKNATQMPVCGDPSFQNMTLTVGNHIADGRSLDGYAWGSPKTFTITSGGCIQVQVP